MKNWTGTAAFAMPCTAPQFETLPGTGLPVAGVAAIASGVVADQRPRNAKLGRPPRESRC